MFPRSAWGVGRRGFGGRCQFLIIPFIPKCGSARALKDASQDNQTCACKPPLPLFFHIPRGKTNASVSFRVMIAPVENGWLGHGSSSFTSSVLCERASQRRTLKQVETVSFSTSKWTPANKRMRTTLEHPERLVAREESESGYSACRLRKRRCRRTRRCASIHVLWPRQQVEDHASG